MMQRDNLIRRLGDAKEPQVLINVIRDCKEFVLEKCETTSLIGVLLRVASRLDDIFSALSTEEEELILLPLFVDPLQRYSHLISSLLALTQCFSERGREGDRVRRVAQSLLSRYVDSHAITSILLHSLKNHSDDEKWLELAEWTEAVATLPGRISSSTRGSRSAHLLSLSIADSLVSSLLTALKHSLQVLSGPAASSDPSTSLSSPLNLRCCSLLLARSRLIPTSKGTNVLRSLLQSLLDQPKSMIWDELCQALIIGGAGEEAEDMSPFQREQLLVSAIEESTHVDHLKRLLGHWLTRSSLLRTVCTVRLAQQRLLPPRTARALAEYLVWAGGVQVAEGLLLKLLSSWSSQQLIQRGDEAMAKHRVRLLLHLGAAARTLNEEASNVFWSSVNILVMGGVNAHLQIPVAHRRHLGMLVAELAVRWTGQESALSFEYEEDPFVEEMLATIDGVESTSTDAERVAVAEDEEKKNSEVPSLDSDDDDLDGLPLPILQISQKDLKSVLKEEEEERKHSPPCYIRDCLEWLREKEKVEKFEAALFALEGLIRKRSHGLEEVATEIVQQLVQLSDRFATPCFEKVVDNCLVAVLVALPPCAVVLGDILYSRHIAMVQRFRVLAVILGAARELSGRGPEEKNESDLDEVSPSTSLLSQDSRHSQHLPDSSNIRRFGSLSSSSLPLPKLNKFSAVAQSFFDPLIRSRVGEHLDLMTRDCALLSRVLHTASEVLLLAVHSPSVVRMAESLCRVVESLRYHDDELLRLSSVYAYYCSSVVLPTEVLSSWSGNWLEFCAERCSSVDESPSIRQLCRQTLSLAAQRLDFPS